jgi:hypothetical protein
LVAGSAGSTAFAAPAVLMAVVMTVLLQALRLASGTVVLRGAGLAAHGPRLR